MPIIVIANHKGGVGKTSNAANLAAYFTNYYKKGLLLDFDPQADCSRMFFEGSSNAVVKIHDLFSYAVGNSLDFSVRDVKLDEFDNMVKKATIIKSFKNGLVSLIASSLDLTKTKIALTSMERLSNFIIPPMIRYLASNYDYTIIDTPPSIELLTFTAVASADYVIIPAEIEATSIRGAKDIIENVLYIVNRYYNPKTKLLGMIINKYNKRTNLTKEYEPSVQHNFGDILFKNKISTSVRLQEMAILRATINTTSQGSKIDQEYEKLAKEIYERIVKLEGSGGGIETNP